MRVAIYIRVSTEEQAKEGFSLAAQREKLTQYAQLHDWTIVGIYMDEGLSAKDTNRPELKKMLQHMEEGYFDGVMVYKLDRLSRTVVDLFSLVDQMKRKGIEFISYMDNVDTSSATGRMFFGFLAVMAQFERENLAERVKMGLEQRTREGKFHGGTPPFGYDHDAQSGELVINEEEAAIVRIIFERYVKGEGVTSINRWLNQRGITSKKNVQWYTNRVRLLLANPIYCGTMRWNVGDKDYFEVEDSAPPIISRETFRKAQEMREVKSKLHPRSVQSEYVFTGALICARCGHKMSGSTTLSANKEKRYQYYRCPYNDHSQCDMPKFSSIRLEKAFMTYISQLDFITDETAATIASSDNETVDHSAEIDALKKELQKIKERRKKWQLLFADDLITIEEYKERTEEDGKRENEIRNELEELEHGIDAEISERSIEERMQAIKQVSAVWDRVDADQKKTMLHLMVDSIVVDYDKESKQVLIKDASFR